VNPKQRRAFRLDVNTEVNVRLDDLNRFIKLQMLDISESGARFRAAVKLPPQARVSFNWMGPSRNPIALQGRIVGARMTDKFTAEYGVQFEMPVAARDRLAQELIEVQRRRVFKPADSAAQTIGDGDVGGRAKRQGYRAAVQFMVSVRVFMDARWLRVRGEAQDLSTGGLLLAMPGDYEEGTPLSLSFVLPLREVDLGGEEKEVVEQTPFGERKKKKLIPVRPFDPIQAKGVVIKKTGIARNGLPTFGVRFVDLPAFQKEEIARFVHAYQLSKLRKAAATRE
jgi:c-di-GMP-binding flagellar brake protein YcgR